MRISIGLFGLIVLVSGNCAVAAQSGQKQVEIPAATAAASEKASSTDVKAKAKVKKAALVERAPLKAVGTTAVLVASIDLRRQRMKVTVDGELVGNWPISSGKMGYETPTGRFRPQWSSKMHYSRKYNNSPMPYSVFFNQGIATHGTSYTSRLGAPASHGCIRLRTANARKFYNLVHRHGYKRTRIVVTGRAKMKRASSQKWRGTAQKPAYRKAVKARRTTKKRYTLRQYDRLRAERYQRRLRRYYQARRFVSHNRY